MRKALLIAFASSLLSYEMHAASASDTESPSTKESPSSINAKAFIPFTGKITRNKVRMRNQAHLDAKIVRELNKGDMIVVVGENEDFYAVQPPPDIKAYVFRTFVLDNLIEGNKVNVRLAPDLEAPIIAQLNSGDRVDGVISPLNSKWVEISPPESARFYVCKDFVEKIGDASVMAVYHKRKGEVNHLLQSTYHASQEEMLKPFQEIHLDGIVKNYQTIIQDFSDFPDQASRARELLAALQEDYLHKKIAYLEAKAQERTDYPEANTSSQAQTNLGSTNKAPLSQEEISGKMAFWLPREKKFFEDWSRNHPGESYDDFYHDEHSRSVVLQGMLEPYKQPVKNRPGDYVLVNKVSNLPIAYLYSTRVNLQDNIGREISISAVERPNNHFAYPAYFVLTVE